MARLNTLLFGFLGIFFSGCLGFSAMDGLGREEAVTETAHKKAAIEDDHIEDKHPEYDASRTVDELFNDYCMVRLNKSASIAKLDVVKPDDDEKALLDTIFSTRDAAAKAVEKHLDDETSLIPSIEVVNGAMKPFNDGLYAAIETQVALGVKADNGETVFPGKRKFLRDLAATLIDMAESARNRNAFKNAAVDIGAALILGGDTLSMPDEFASESKNRAQLFRADPLYARPIGFYTWTDTLGQIFSQDRFLQNYQGEETPYTDREFEKAAAMAVAINSDDSLTERYQRYLALYIGLTNPYMNYPVTVLLDYLDTDTALDDIPSLTDRFLADNPPPTLMPSCQPRFALFPSSKSKETLFFESQFCRENSAIAGNINYMDTLIIAIRDGLVDLSPESDSGWYDYQSFALEVLLLPEQGSESDHLLLTKSYKEKLVESFKTIMTQTRETHVKQLEVGKSDTAAANMDVDIYPNFPVEPFPTFYLRSARAYRFLHAYLDTVMGESVLERTFRFFENGTQAETSVAAELDEKIALLYGLHLISADAVGMAPELLPEELAEFDETTCREQAREWVSNWLTDPDVARDSRVIVPVQHEVDFEKTVYWATLGTRIVKAETEYVKGHEPKVLNGSYDDIPQHLLEKGVRYCEVREMVPHTYFLMVDTFAEVRLNDDTPPPTRDELRDILDTHNNVDDMVTALEAL